MNIQGKQNEIGERINNLIFKLGKNKSTFASSLGVSHTAISKTIKGETKPGLQLIDSITKTYPQLSRDWLMEGKGEMFLTDIPQAKPDGYLMEFFSKIEGFMKQIETKDRQIEYYQRQNEQLMGMLGKFEGALFGQYLAAA